MSEKQYSLRLTTDELEQARILAKMQNRSINGLFRSLLRQAINKSMIDLPAKTKKTHKIEVEAEYA